MGSAPGEQPGCRLHGHPWTSCSPSGAFAASLNQSSGHLPPGRRATRWRTQAIDWKLGTSASSSGGTQFSAQSVSAGGLTIDLQGVVSLQVGGTGTVDFDNNLVSGTVSFTVATQTVSVTSGGSTVAATLTTIALEATSLTVGYGPGLLQRQRVRWARDRDRVGDRIPATRARGRRCRADLSSRHLEAQRTDAVGQHSRDPAERGERHRCKREP